MTLRGRTLITTARSERQETELNDDAEVLAAYRDHFGLTLARPPEVRRQCG